MTPQDCNASLLLGSNEPPAELTTIAIAVAHLMEHGADPVQRLAVASRVSEAAARLAARLGSMDAFAVLLAEQLIEQRAEVCRDVECRCVAHGQEVVRV
jgi:hypothetical protein